MKSKQRAKVLCFFCEKGSPVQGELARLAVTEGLFLYLLQPLTLISFGSSPCTGEPDFLTFFISKIARICLFIKMTEKTRKKLAFFYKNPVDNLTI